jgi:hypothetical protein
VEAGDKDAAHGVLGGCLYQCGNSVVQTFVYLVRTGKVEVDGAKFLRLRGRQSSWRTFQKGGVHVLDFLCFGPESFPSLPAGALREVI